VYHKTTHICHQTHQTYIHAVRDLLDKTDDMNLEQQQQKGSTTSFIHSWYNSFLLFSPALHSWEPLSKVAIDGSSLQADLQPKSIGFS